MREKTVGELVADLRATDSDPEVDRPAHYDGDRCMVELEDAGFGRGGCLFNIGKYLWRLGKKGRPKQDAEKAMWYARRFAEKGCYGEQISPEELKHLMFCGHVGLSQLTEDEARLVLPITGEITDLLKTKLTTTKAETNAETRSS